MSTGLNVPRRLGLSSTKARTVLVPHQMLLAQSLSMCLLCFGVGTMGAVLFGMVVRSGGLPPFLLAWEIIGGVLAAQEIVGMVGPAMSVVRLHCIQPEEADRN